MKVQCAHGTMRKLEDLKPHPKNPNQHPERQIDLLAKIIKKNWMAVANNRFAQIRLRN